MTASLPLAAALVVLTALSAAAQTRLPRMSPAEESYTETNRSLQRRGQQLSQEQQTQFEVNQLRQDQGRRQLYAPQPGSGVGRICAPGQLGC